MNANEHARAGRYHHLEWNVDFHRVIAETGCKSVATAIHQKKIFSNSKQTSV